MCGRYASTRGASDLAGLFDAAEPDPATGDESLAPSWNVAPTDPIHVVRAGPPGTGRRVCVARWGLLPPWAADARAAARMINARAETLRTSRAYREPFLRRRCLVPADGWYEWRRDPPGRGRQPFYLTPRGGGVLAFAGLWQVWRGMVTATIVTRPALGDLASLHDRMPLVLPPEWWEAWLAGPAALAGEVLEAPGELAVSGLVAGIEMRPVAPAVGDVRNNSPDLIRAVPGDLPVLPDPESGDLTLF